MGVERPMGDDHPNVVPEVRTRRLVVVNEAGAEQAVLEVLRGVTEITIGAGQSRVPCEAVVYAGEHEPGHYAAGVELWADGNSVAGIGVTMTGSVVEFHQFMPEVGQT